MRNTMILILGVSATLGCVEPAPSRLAAGTYDGEGGLEGPLGEDPPGSPMSATVEALSDLSIRVMVPDLSLDLEFAFAAGSGRVSDEWRAIDERGWDYRAWNDEAFEGEKAGCRYFSFNASAVEFDDEPDTEWFLGYEPDCP